MNQFMLWFLEKLSPLVIKLISVLSAMHGKIADKLLILRLNKLNNERK